MTHIQAYVNLMILDRQFGLNKEAATYLTANMLQVFIPHESVDLVRILEDKPNKKQIAHELHRMGYRTAFIADFLGVTPQYVSNALQTPPRRTYYNVALSSWGKSSKLSEMYHVRQKLGLYDYLNRM